MGKTVLLISKTLPFEIMSLEVFIELLWIKRLLGLTFSWRVASTVRVQEADVAADVITQVVKVTYRTL